MELVSEINLKGKAMRTFASEFYGFHLEVDGLTADLSFALEEGNLERAEEVRRELTALLNAYERSVQEAVEALASEIPANN